MTEIPPNLAAPLLFVDSVTILTLTNKPIKEDKNNVSQFFPKRWRGSFLLHSATRGRVRCFGLYYGAAERLLAAGGTRGAAVV